MISVLNHLQPSSGNKKDHQLQNKYYTEANLASAFFLNRTASPQLRFFVCCFLAFISASLLIVACSPKTAPVRQEPQTSTSTKPKQTQTEETAAKPAEKPKPVVKQKEHLQLQISLILPFELKSIDYRTATNSDLRKAEIAIDFYQGFKLGLDSVTHEKGNVDFTLNVFDSNDNPSALATLAAKEAIKNADLVVGPIFPNGIKAFSVHSKNMQKPMVSPLAASDPNLFHNPFLITINNFLDQHAYKAAAFIKSDLRPKKIVMIRSGQADEYKFAVPFKKGIDSLAKGYHVSELGIKAVGYENVYKHLSPVGLNVIVLPATERVFLHTMFKELEKLSRNFQIAVIGHPAWEKLTFLDYQQLESLNTYLTSSYLIDYRSSRVQDFVRNYHYQYSLEPSEYAFKAFDIAYYFGLLMDAKGKKFMESLTDEDYRGLHNNFKFTKSKVYGYYNLSLMMLKIENGNLVKAD